MVEERKYLTALKHLRLFIFIFSAFQILAIATTAFSTFRYTGVASLITAEY